MNRACYVIFISLILDLISFTLILPLMPSILDYYAQNDQSGTYVWCFSFISKLQNALNAPSTFTNVFFGGILGSWFCFLQFVFSPILGSLSDLFGRKPCLLFSYIGLVLGYVLWAYSGNSFALFLLSRTIGGICKANIPLAMAIMADLCDQKTRAKGMALIGIAFSIGFTIGPLLGAMYIKLVGSTSTTFPVHFYPAQLAFILSSVNLLFTSKFYNESLPKDKRIRSIGNGLSKAFDFINPFSLFRFSNLKQANEIDLARIRYLGLIYFLFMFFYSGLEFTLTFLTHLQFKYTSMQQGKMYLFCGLVMMFVQGGFVRRLKQGFESKITIAGLFTVIPAFLTMGICSNSMQLYGSLAFYAFSSASVVPCLTAIISNLASKQEQGVVLGTFRSIGAFARAFGPFVCSFVFWKYGATLCYVIGGLALFIPFIMMCKLSKHTKAEKFKE